MSRSPQWQVAPSGDFNSDLNRLGVLIDVICELKFNLADDERDARVDDLLWIAREMSNGLTAHHNDTFKREGVAS